MQEETLTTVLTSESVAGMGVPVAQILQESEDGAGNEINKGVMRVRVPFYVVDSKVKIPFLPKPLVWPSSTLDQIVQEGNAQIAQKKQPLTVYPRHAHALSGRDLPCGDVVLLERNGRLGMATIDVAPTSVGKDVQVLVRSGKLNAVSLRSHKGAFVLADGTLDKEPVLVCEKLGMAGIDFAPDDPAQETFGIEILNEGTQVVLTSEEPKPEPNKGQTMDTLTLEVLRKDHSALVDDIEKPLRKELKEAKEKIQTLTQENEKLVGEQNAAKLESFVSEIAQRSSNPEEFRKVFTALCQEKGVKDVAGATPYVVPLLLGALDATKSDPPSPSKSPQTMLQELFPQKPAGSGEPGQEPKADDKEPVLTQEEQDAQRSRTTLGGLVLPEGV